MRSVLQPMDRESSQPMTNRQVSTISAPINPKSAILDTDRLALFDVSLRSAYIFKRQAESRTSTIRFGI
jgi:hypothetical protein